MIPEIFRIGPIPINSFGLMLVCAFLATWRLLEINIKRDGDDGQLAETLVFWAAIGGIVGARLLYLTTYSSDFFSDPLGSLFGGAGFVFYGGLFGGALAVVIALKRAGKNITHYADLIAPTIALGYAIGRVGCQLSGDGDYGIASTLPWAMGYPLGVIPTGAGELVHPAPVYETLFSLVAAVLLQHLLYKSYFKTPGALFGLMLVLMAVERFLVEFIRIEPLVAQGLTQAQWVSIGLMIFGGWIAYGRRRLA